MKYWCSKQHFSVIWRSFGPICSIKFDRFGPIRRNFQNQTEKVFWLLNLWFKCFEIHCLTVFLNAESISAIKIGVTHIRFWEKLLFMIFGVEKNIFRTPKLVKFPINIWYFVILMTSTQYLCKLIHKTSHFSDQKCSVCT